jgi:antitoxin HicB
MNGAQVKSTLDAILREVREQERVGILARKKALALQLEEARQAGNVSISELARRMGTSRMAVHSLLDTASPPMTIDSVSRAAAALGLEFETRIVPRRPAGPQRARTKQKVNR